MKERIGILGCGWLGFPLAKRLISMGYQVSGTTTTKANLELLRNEGINSFYVELLSEGVKGTLIDFLKDLSLLIVNVPPKRKAGESDYLEKISQLYEACKIMHLKKIIFVSSTSVYGDLQGEVTEKSHPRPSNDSARAILSAEKLFSEDPSMSASVIRFGGLIGPDRHPVTYLSGQQNLSNGDDYVNLIHLEDCLGIISAIISNAWWGKCFNGVYPLHPSKREYYTREARNRGLPEPGYKKSYAGKTGKLVKSKALEALEFKFNTPIDSHS